MYGSKHSAAVCFGDVFYKILNSNNKIRAKKIEGNMKSYLIIIELNTTGYIVGTEETLVEAEIRVDKMCNESTIYSFHELEKYHAHLKEYRSYTINGNVNIIEKVKQQLTNGILSYYILEIDEKTFSF